MTVLSKEFFDKRLAGLRIGIFGKLCKPARVLSAGDRVEIYRPLTADPKTVRRELAAAGKSLGKQGRDDEDQD